MLLADEPPEIATAVADDAGDVIEVVGARAEDGLKIDRRMYQVRETPHSAQKNVIQLLRGLPAVTVTTDDRILVLGAGRTRIYVDGRPYPGDTAQFLRTVRGGDIERIEVITNPSAQFSADGVGGVINLVLRKNRTEGLSGNVSLEESSYGHALVDTTLKRKDGDWSYEVKAGGNIGSMVRRTYRQMRSIEAQPGDARTVSRQSGRFTYDGTVGRLSGKATYKLDARTSVSAQLGGGGGHDIQTDKVAYRALTPDFIPFFEHRRLSSLGSNVSGEVSVERAGPKEGDALTASAQFYTNPSYRNRTTARFSDGHGYRIDLRNPTTTIDAQIDGKRTLAAGLVVSLGSSWRSDDTAQTYRFSSDGDAGSLGPDRSDAYTARNSTLAAYASLQQTIGALTLAPGLRAESNARRISSPGAADIRIDRTDLFPSFHASYKRNKRLQFTASMSRRIDRVPLHYLRPFGTVEDAYTLFEGNPRLKDQSTNAYEAGIQYRAGKIEAGATAYWRETRKLWRRTYALNPTGVSVYSYANLGESLSSGAQLDLSFPVFPRVKANVSANLFNERNPIDLADGQGAQQTFRYTTNGALEWASKDRGAIPGDVAQVQWSYNSPARDYQMRNGSWYDFSGSYTHSFDRTLSLSATFRYSGRVSQRLTAPSVEEVLSRRSTPEVQLKLLKTL